tara:strand:- start:809 stop:1444 length:636 start_codon:yes stop_codon:yes gene_type:complete
MTIKKKIINTNIDQIGVCNRYVSGDVIIYCCPFKSANSAIGRLTGKKFDSYRWTCANSNYAFPEKHIRFATQEEKELLGNLDYLKLKDIPDIPEPTITLNKAEYETTCAILSKANELINENAQLNVEVGRLNNTITRMRDADEVLIKTIEKLTGSLIEANIRIEKLEEEIHNDQELARTAELLGVQVAALKIENVELSNKLNTIFHISKND